MSQRAELEARPPAWPLRLAIGLPLLTVSLVALSAPPALAVALVRDGVARGRIGSVVVGGVISAVSALLLWALVKQLWRRLATAR